ncbi:MAG: hypothetical protein KC917_09135 [Candidatus Omnitrophica bacterium]|nr:hypothetical protein [Candidatus Omnitrophota bacterium]
MNPFQTLGRFLTLASLLVCFALLIAKPIFGEEKLRGSRPAPDWDTYSDTWMATDALGRTVATHDEVGPPRPDR